MSAVRWPDHLLTLDEWLALPTDDSSPRCELVQGVLHMTPSPTIKHQRAAFILAQQIEAVVVGKDLLTVCDVDVVLTPGFPPTVRRPDLVVVPSRVVSSDPVALTSADVLLTVRIVPPGSRRIDRVMTPADYADAGISPYWIADLDGGVTLDAYRLEHGRYETTIGAAKGRVDVDLDGIGTVALDLDALVA